MLLQVAKDTFRLTLNIALVPQSTILQVINIYDHENTDTDALLEPGGRTI